MLRSNTEKALVYIYDWTPQTARTMRQSPKVCEFSFSLLNFFRKKPLECETLDVKLVKKTIWRWLERQSQFSILWSYWLGVTMLQEILFLVLAEEFVSLFVTVFRYRYVLSKLWWIWAQIEIIFMSGTTLFNSRSPIIGHGATTNAKNVQPPYSLPPAFRL